MIPVDPLTATIGFLVYMAFRKQAGSKYGQMTPEREEVFKNAMEFLRDPQRMIQLAEEFQKEGLKFQAFLLRKRAEWRGRSDELKMAHDQIFNKALASENVKAILDVAKAFEDMTATVKARKLRERASQIRANEMKKKEEEALVMETKAREAENAKRNSPPKMQIVEMPAEELKAAQAAKAK